MSKEPKQEPQNPQPASSVSDSERIHQLETLLRESEERHALLIEGVKDFAVFALDPNGHITWWGEGARRLAGYHEDEILGKHFSILFTPEDRDQGLPERELQTAAESGNAVDENWIVRKDGERFWGSGFSAPRRSDGRLTGYIKVLRDLTERQHAHEALHESELRLRAALAAADMGTWLWQVPTDKQVIDENLHRLMGVPSDRSIVTLEDFLSFIHEEDRDAVREAFLRSIREGCPLVVEFRVTGPNGSVRWLRDKGEVFRDEQGRVLYLTGAAVDVTERREMMDHLRWSRDDLEQRVRQRTAELERSQERTLQAERLATIGQTVTALAHEGRNALQRAHACLARLAMRQENQPEELDLTRRAQVALDDLERLFSDIRAYAAPIRLELATCDLKDVWHKAWAQLSDRHGQRDARLEESVLSTNLSCEADPFRLAQVFMNLFTNALEACSDPVLVRVTCTEVDLEGGRSGLRVSVRDNGSGFAPQQRRYLFEPFHTTKPTGTGLGMAICRRILEAHGGTIEAGETTPGAEVVITLPHQSGKASAG